jgi:tetratricopeptide (TPR) repeat protein
MALQTYSSPDTELTNKILLVAENKYKNRDYLGSLTEYTRAIQLDPYNANAWCCRGVAYYRLGDCHNASIDYTRAIELDPNLSIAYYRRGFLHYISKDYGSAIADYNRSIDLNPNFALAYSNRGYAYRDLYGDQEAVIDWRFAAKLFKEQGNLPKYESMMNLINKINDLDTFASGMLW